MNQSFEKDPLGLTLNSLSLYISIIAHWDTFLTHIYRSIFRIFSSFHLKINPSLYQDKLPILNYTGGRKWNSAGVTGQRGSLHCTCCYLYQLVSGGLHCWHNPKHIHCINFILKILRELWMWSMENYIEKWIFL